MPSSSRDTDLQKARAELEMATESAPADLRKPIRETAAAFAEIAVDEGDADHAVFDEHLNTLRQVRADADGETADRLDIAIERAEAYRVGLEQA